ncbi:MAG: dihydroorotate dehydrogenase electron transfer subunit [Candidatus Omnitrophica bacterium]|nr:dihydroorotate dehydrogenase electron transfer subunit [Candidatus Omnitrophota bacterium]
MIKAIQEKIKVIENKKIGGRYFRIKFYSKHISSCAYPGQFVEIKVSSASGPLLRRPLGVHSVGKNSFSVLGEIVGKGTKILSTVRPAEEIDVIGPLGSGFTFSSAQCAVLVAGGMGVAPLLFLAETIRELKAKSAKRKIVVLIGAKSKESILCAREFKKLKADVRIATDDGSLGHKGKITDLLQSQLSALSLQPSTVYACGPDPMLREVARVAETYNIPAQVSLEQHMACGIGACLGCVIKVKSQKPTCARGMPNSKVKSDFEYKRVCKEGPVFDARQIVWEGS